MQNGSGVTLKRLIQLLITQVKLSFLHINAVVYTRKSMGRTCLSVVSSQDKQS